jgi:hypothetical protein
MDQGESMSPLAAFLTQALTECHGVAAAIRYTTTFNPGVSIQDMLSAGRECGVNAGTIRNQFRIARREDAEMDAMQAAFEVTQGTGARSCLTQAIKHLTNHRSHHAAR